MTDVHIPKPKRKREGGDGYDGTDEDVPSSKQQVDLCPACHSTLTGFALVICGVCGAQGCTRLTCHGQLTDVNRHNCCAATSLVCGHCNQLFCTNACTGGHGVLVDVNGDNCCAASSATCGLCNQLLCTNACTGGHNIANASCGHQACPGTVGKCAACTKLFCAGCKASFKVDLCTDCAKPMTKKVCGHINVKYERIPGAGGKLMRPLAAEGPIKVVSVSTPEEKRASPPPPISSGQTDKDAEIEELKYFDRGHLFALELDGDDDAYQIAPMIRQVNRAPGTWRTMELNIVKLIGGENLVLVDNNALPCDTSTVHSNIDLSLRTSNTVDANWHMEVHLFYDDAAGDRRIPVWFYVRVLFKKHLWTHFSIGNFCDEKPSNPDKDEQIEFALATNVYAALSGTDRAKIASVLAKDLYAAAGNGLVPNQILEFMDDVNTRCDEQSVARVFKKMQDVSKGTSKPYDDFQRLILRKYSRWKNAGALKSDVVNDWQYEEERKDAYQVLSDCGGRSAPEVDHIFPSYQAGGNWYINARLVSFFHNHLYREKKESGSRPMNVELLKRFQSKVTEERLAFMSTKKPIMARHWWNDEKTIQVGAVQAKIWIGSDAVVNGTKLVKAFLDEHFADAVLFQDDANFKVSGADWPYTDKNLWPLVKDRQTYKKAALDREEKYKKEANLQGSYGTMLGKHRAALQDFVETASNAERKRLLALIDGAIDKSNNKLPLCKPSDQLKTNGGLVDPPVAQAYEHFDANAAKGESEYTTVEGRWDVLKGKLGIT